MSYNLCNTMDIDNSVGGLPGSHTSQHPQQHLLRNDERRSAAEVGLNQHHVFRDSAQSLVNSMNKKSSYMLSSNMGKYNFMNTNGTGPGTGNFAAKAAGKYSAADGNDSENNFWTQKFDRDNYISSRHYGLCSIAEIDSASASSNIMSMASTYENNGADMSFGTNSSDSGRDLNSTANRDHDLVGTLKLQLQIKETQNECLENEIQKFKKIFNEGLSYKQMEYKHDHQNAHVLSDPIEIPHNLELIFRRLSETLRQRKKELEEATQSLEAVLTALALDPTNSVTRYGRYDAENISHKMVVRLETLTNENKEMAKMLAYGRSKETQIELQLVKKENAELKAKINQMQQ